MKRLSLRSRSGWREHWLAVLVALVFLALALWYNITLPVGESDNEVSHYRYVQYIKAEGKLPPTDYVWPAVPTADQCEVVREPAAQNPEHQFRQPPLYYLLTAAATAWLDTSDNWWPPNNPFGVMARNNIEGGINVSIHSAREAFPYEGTTRAVHVMRFVSTLIGLAGLVAVYLSGRLVFRLLPGPGAALLMATIAFIPTYLFAASVITNDILAGALGMWCIYFCLRSTLDKVHLGYYWLALLAMTLAILTKYYSVVLILPIGVTSMFLLVKARREGSKRFWTSLAVVALAVIAHSLLPIWWFMRNLSLYGTLVVDYPNVAKPLGAEMAWAGNSASAGLLRKLVEDWAFTFDTFWGLLGADVVRLPTWLTSTLFVVCVACGIGIIWKLLDKHQPRTLKVLALLALALFLAGGAILYLLNELAALRGRYLLVLFPLAGFLLVWGSSALRTRRFPWLGSTLLAVLLLSISVAIPVGLIQPAYARPVTSAEVTLAPGEQPVHATFGDFAELVAVEIEPKNIAPYQPLQVTLVWRVLKPTTNNYIIGVHLIGADQTFYGGTAHMPAKGNFATSLWQPGDIFRDSYRLYLETVPDRKLPTRGTVKITMYCATPTDQLYVPVADSAEVPLGDAIYAGSLRLGRPVTATPGSETPVLARFGDEINLLAVTDPSSGSVMDGQGAASLPLQFTWQAQQPPRADYTLFLHVLDAAGNYVTGLDERLTQDYYPSSLWSAGEVVTDVHPSDLASLLRLPQGTYRLTAGLYDRQTMQRLPVTSASLPANADGIILGSWEITGSSLFIPFAVNQHTLP